jgi:hypothetical protein
MPTTPLSLEQSRLGINFPLTNLAQGYINAEYVLRLLFPLVEVGRRGGQIIESDRSVYEEVDDSRADDTPYPEIQSGYSGKPFSLDTKGLSYRVGHKLKEESGDLKINWGQVAVDQIMNKFGLMHEKRCAIIASDPNNYSADNRIALAAGGQFNDPAVDPIRIVRRGSTAIARKTGRRPNVIAMGTDVFDELANRYGNAFVSPEGVVRTSLTNEQLAALLSIQRVVVCDAISTPSRGIEPTPIMGKHLVLAYTNPKALNGDSLPYRTNTAVNFMEYSMGYTYVYQGNPRMLDTYEDKDRRATVYQGDFDRQVVRTGVDDNGKIIGGYLIANAVA